MLRAAFLATIAAAPLAASRAQEPVLPPAEQIAAAVLPLPEALRSGAGVRGYTPSRSLVTLRETTNGIVCTADRPGDAVFDVRCYDRGFLAVIDRRRELARTLADTAAQEQRFAEEVRDGRLRLPDHPTAGYRMLGPIQAYNARSHEATAAIEKWQSIHFPYRTAAELGLPIEREGTMPFVMASGTWWAHVMIVHAPARPSTTVLPN